MSAVNKDQDDKKVHDGFMKITCPYCGERLLDSPSGTARIKCGSCRRILMIQVEQGDVHIRG